MPNTKKKVKFSKSFSPMEVEEKYPLSPVNNSPRSSPKSIIKSNTKKRGRGKKNYKRKLYKKKSQRKSKKFNKKKSNKHKRIQIGCKNMKGGSGVNPIVDSFSSLGRAFEGGFNTFTHDLAGKDLPISYNSNPNEQDFTKHI